MRRVCPNTGSSTPEASVHPMNSTTTASREVADGEAVERSVRSASLIAGVGLLAMIGPALFGAFVVVDGLVTPGDATATAVAIQENAVTFRLGIVALLAVAILDVIVAWALYTVFEPANRRVAQLAMLFRVVYAGVFVVAIGQLAGVVGMLTDAPAGFPTEQLHAQATFGVGAFSDVWNAGLLVFAVHLLLLGYLAYRADYAPTFLGFLLAVAGLGYAVDGLGAVLLADSLGVAVVTFVGEVVLIGWLLLGGRRVSFDAGELPTAT